MNTSRSRLCASALILFAVSLMAAALFWRSGQRLPIESALIADYGGIAVMTKLPDLPRHLTSRTDAAQPQNKSRLVLFENGEPLKSPHSLHAEIAEKGGGRYSHWGTAEKDGEWLIFSSSDSTDPRSNQRRYEAVREVSLSANIKAGVFAVSIGVMLFAVWTLRKVLMADAAAMHASFGDFRKSAWRRREAIAALSKSTRYFGPAYEGFCWFALSICLAAGVVAIGYALLILFAALGGWALPTTAPILQFPAVRQWAIYEPHFSEAVLLLAGAGLALQWAASMSKPPFAIAGAETRRCEVRIARTLCFFGLPILFALFVFSVSAQWVGLSRPGDLFANSIAGLVPFSDANGYWADANDFAKDGEFRPFSARRPLAQVFRTGLGAAGGYSYAGMIIAQCLALSAAAFVAALSVGRWLGVWAGLAFAALAYTTARTFATTTLTEPIGYFWALLAIPFFVEALKSRSIAHAVLALAVLSVALWSRMGSMFTPPLLILWIALAFGGGWARMFRHGAYAVAAFGLVVALNFSAAKLYAHDVSYVGGNFSFTLCGISIGGIWSDCQERYKDELPSAAKVDERAMNAEMYRRAFENMAARPMVAVRRLATASGQFVSSLPSILTRGYLAAPPLFSTGVLLILALSAARLLLRARAMSSTELLFWGLFWIGALVSAGFVFMDDGRRVMIAVYPLIALFLLRGWGPKPIGGGVVAAPSPPFIRARMGAAIAAGLCAVSLVAPILASKAASPSTYISRPPGSSDHFVFGGARMTGVLVVADGAKRDPRVPTVHVSEFARMVERSGIEGYQNLVTPAPPPTPFAFVLSPSLVLGEPTTHQFIAPPELLTRRDVKAWRLETTDFGKKEGGFGYWLLVTKATPLGQPETPRP